VKERRQRSESVVLEAEAKYYRCNNLPGSMMMLFSKPKTPSTAIPSNLNGKVSNQKTGYKTKARIASGQQSIKRMIQAMNVNIDQR